MLRFMFAIAFAIDVPSCLPARCLSVVSCSFEDHRRKRKSWGGAWREEVLSLFEYLNVTDEFDFRLIS